MDSCIVANCGERAREKGMCRPHYARWKRHGDPLGGRIPPGTGEAWLRAHKDYPLDTCLLWPFGRGGNGYAALHVDGERFYAHRFMCTLAHGDPPPDALACHSCGAGKQGCVNPRHLSWGTKQSNTLDSIAHGTHRTGERASNVKLTQDHVNMIRANPEKKLQRELADLLGVSPGTISKIQRRTRWK